MQITRRSTLLGGGLAALALAGCSGGGASDRPIRIGYIESWTDTVSLAFVLKRQLEAMGHEVEFETLGDAALMYAALASGDIDIFSSAWPDVTHASYMEEFGGDIEDLVTYNAGAMNMLAVLDRTDITSIEELAADPGRFGGRIIGIEPGAGLTGMVTDAVIPEYGLADAGLELVTSSTAAMLAELESATDSGEDVVVTLWKPFWANQVYPVRQLEDPRGAFGEPETMHVLGRTGFAETWADAAAYIGDLALSDDQYATLEDKVVNEFGEGQEADAVEAWIEENPDVLPPLPETQG
ncbi:glycine betaine ABC transporter substrate-binding protein [Brachybacterium hainanense]|uniref:Glycine betaine ABC transporter substrate-binding protein n=1 Tax=Brachybacterium hainanense TaxID=1541174 RepID=A0ABV6R691_9MICO